MSEKQTHSWIMELRERLSSPPPRRLPPRERRQAAVLVPLYVDAGELWVVLTRRTGDLPTHRNQIAFPGGASEAGENSWETALRESEEEVGFDTSRILQIGELDEMDALASGYRILPCVGALAFPFTTRLNTTEIAEVFPVPLSAVANPRLVENREVSFEGVVRQMRVYHVGSRQIWGVTAKILQNLMQRLGLEPYLEEET